MNPGKSLCSCALHIAHYTLHTVQPHTGQTLHLAPCTLHTGWVNYMHLSDMLQATQRPGWAEIVSSEANSTLPTYRSFLTNSPTSIDECHLILHIQIDIFKENGTIPKSSLKTYNNGWMLFGCILDHNSAFLPTFGQYRLFKLFHSNLLKHLSLFLLQVTLEIGRRERVFSFSNPLFKDLNLGE